MAAPAAEGFVPIVRRLAFVFAMLVTIALPSAYFGMKYANLADRVALVAEVKAGAINGLVAANPNMWMFQAQRLEELLLRYSVPLTNDRATVRDAAGNVVQAAGGLPDAPVVARTYSLYDSGRMVGSVEIASSYRPVVFGTLVVVLLSVLLGAIAYAVVFFLPLRALRRVSAALTDETARLWESEAHLIEARRKAQQLIEILPTPIFFKDTAGRYLGVNQAWEDFFGTPRDAFLGKTVHDLYPDNPAIADRLTADDQILWDKPGTPHIHEESITTRDGTRREAIFYKATFTHADGSVAGLIGTIIDITERKQAEAKLVALTAELEARVVSRTAELARALEAATTADRMKAEFMANVTHELRTPLNSVIGFAELLKESVAGPLNAKQAAFAADILEGGKRLLQLVEGILEISRLDAGGAALEREPVAIGAAIEARVAAHRRVAEQHAIAIELDMAPDAGRADLNPHALQRMLNALIDNAIKFNRDGGTVTVNARRANGALEIAVADTGIGIAREDLARLFKPLVQLDGGLARKHAGIGLGLTLARRLAELHGGTLEVASEPGKGSTFTLRFPMGETS